MVDSPIGHEDFKDGILVRAAGGNLPDVFSYWAGARTQFVVDGGSLATIDTMWASYGLGSVVAKSVADGATNYNSSRYLVPFGYHYAGMFYNAKVMAEAGVTEFPTDWDGFLALCENLKAQGITPIALGSKFRWPGQFWFDYLLLRTAGPDYRAALMAGESFLHRPGGAAGDGAVEGFGRCRLLRAQRQRRRLDRRFRQGGARRCGDDADGHLDHRLLERPGPDGRGRLRLFEFPAIDDGVANAVVGPVDGWLISADAENRENAEALVAFMASDPESQAKWAQIQGALSPNVNVDDSIYTPVMMRALEAVNNADTFAFNYDLATTPPAAEFGLDMFARFMDSPADYMQHLADTEEGARGVFDS